MNMRHFNKRFASMQRAPHWFIKDLKTIHPNLDCFFNILESRWQVIRWKASPLVGDWWWVMTIQGPDQSFMPPGSYALARVAYLKKVFEYDQAIKLIEEEEKVEEQESQNKMGNLYHELAKDLRKPLLNAYDGLVSTWNNFI
jgi:hypothetical protein